MEIVTTVIVVPSQEPQPVQVAQSQVYVLECRVQDEPESQIRWFKQGLEVQEDDRHKIEKLVDGQQRLIVQLANETDIATYTCEARTCWVPVQPRRLK